MPPQWLQDVFKRLTCTRCKRLLCVPDILEVGIQYRGVARYQRKSFIYMTVRCSACKQHMRVSDERPLQDALDAVAACHKHLFRSTDNNSTSSPNAATIPGVPHPHRFKFPPTTPITDKEVQAFVNRLQRTSFKRKSKGYRAWMRDLGADIDNKNTPGADDIPF